ncbi:CapA family protein [Aggregatilinea lenta]|uniref:CapA family protein n=1 Tax=Aggregatilinea lenta TaxID=913108 RepID=UPI000E5C21F4|nr:CapA family protein [Aggregatilinea lenta]
MRLLCVGDVAIAGDDLPKMDLLLPTNELKRDYLRVLFNWELPMGRSVNPLPRTSGPRIIGNSAGAIAIKRWPQGFAALANNHILDAEVAGLLETQTTLKETGFIPFGAGFSQTAIQEPTVWNGPEGRLGILNWVFPETHPEWGVIPGPNCWPGIDAGSQAIRELKKTVDWILVAPHWGDEDFAYPTLTERTIARALIEAGADLIIGHHPHVVRGMEMINGKPVYYSLGNFYFSKIQDQQGNRIFKPVARNREALVISVTLKRGQRPELEALSYWQGSNGTSPDRWARAVSRMKRVSRPLAKLSGPEYTDWYVKRRARFDRWEYRLHFSLQQKGWKGVLQYPLVLLERHHSRISANN